MPVTLDDIREKREEIIRLADEHRARHVRVFGSVARGTAEPWSDVDFVIETLAGHSLFDRAGLTVALSELLGVPVDVVADGELRGAIHDRVAAEAVAV